MMQMQQERMLWANMGTETLRFLCTQCDAFHLAKYFNISPRSTSTGLCIMKHTMSYLFYHQKVFDYILQKQPCILAQIFSVGFGKKKKKNMELTEKSMAGHRARALGSGISLGHGQLFTRKFLHPLNRRTENNSLLPNSVKFCLFTVS